MKTILLIILFTISLNAQEWPLIFYGDVGITYGSAPNFETVGAIGQGTTSVAVPYPASIAENDILLMQIQVKEAGEDPTVNVPSGWARIDSVESPASPQNGFYIFWARAAGTETGNLTVVGAGNEDMKGIMGRWSGCILTGTPYESLTNTGRVVGSTVTTQAIVTLAPNRLAVALINVMDDVTSGAMTNYVETYDDNELAGSPDATFVGEALDVASAGTVAEDTATISGSDIHVVFTFALKPTED